MIRIILADDQGMILGTLSSLLNMEEDFEVVGTAKNGQEAVELVKELEPDICMMDIEMPIKTGLGAAEELHGSNCKIIILTTFARKGYFERARKARVHGFLLKDSSTLELAEAIRTVMSGRRVYAPELIDSDHDNVTKEKPLTGRKNKLPHLV